MILIKVATSIGGWESSPNRELSAGQISELQAGLILDHASSLLLPATIEQCAIAEPSYGLFTGNRIPGLGLLSWANGHPRLSYGSLQ